PDEAVRGSARVANVPCPVVASLAVFAIAAFTGCGAKALQRLADDYPAYSHKFGEGLSKLDGIDDAAADALVDILNDADLLVKTNQAPAQTVRGPMYAAASSSMTTEAAGEYFKSVHFWRDANGDYPKGILVPDGSPGSSANMTNVGVDGIGVRAISHAFEPY